MIGTLLNDVVSLSTVLGFQDTEWGWSYRNAWPLLAERLQHDDAVLWLATNTKPEEIVRLAVVQALAREQDKALGLVVVDMAGTLEAWCCRCGLLRLPPHLADVLAAVVGSASTSVSKSTLSDWLPVETAFLACWVDGLHELKNGAPLRGQFAALNCTGMSELLKVVAQCFPDPDPDEMRMANTCKESIGVLQNCAALTEELGNRWVNLWDHSKTKWNKVFGPEGSLGC